MSKNRVTPIKIDGQNELSLPRLELTAAVCAARLQNYIVCNSKLFIEAIYLWTDSKITIHWIKGKVERWKPYVANRVREIQSLTKNCIWRHCPGQDNPADMVTRGTKARKLISSDVWKTWSLLVTQIEMKQSALKEEEEVLRTPGPEDVENIKNIARLCLSLETRASPIPVGINKNSAQSRATGVWNPGVK